MDNIQEAATDAVKHTVIDQTSAFVSWLKGFLTFDNLFKVIGAVIMVLIMWIIYKLLLRFVKRIPEEKTTKHRQLIIVKFIKYCFYIIVLIYVLGLFGINLKAIWGAAGIAGVAIGFAAQTSVSNLISGLFVLTEGTLKVGDVIIVGDITGVVDNVSLLSVRVHTLDNQMVRIPNSDIINTKLINNSYNEIRRMTIGVSVAYDTDMDKALEALKKAPDLCPSVLQDPAPAVWFDGFADSGINMVVAGWFKIENFIAAKNELYIAIKKVFDEAGIEIPFNQLDVKIKENA